jgi:hypothetical protein
VTSTREPLIEPGIDHVALEKSHSAVMCRWYKVVRLALSQVTEPSAAMARIACPAGQVPVTRT